MTPLAFFGIVFLLGALCVVAGTRSYLISRKMEKDRRETIEYLQSFEPFKTWMEEEDA